MLNPIEDTKQHKLSYCIWSLVVWILSATGIWFGFHIQSSMSIIPFLAWIMMCTLLFLIAFATWIFYVGLIIKK